MRYVLPNTIHTILAGGKLAEPPSVEASCKDCKFSNAFRLPDGDGMLRYYRHCQRNPPPMTVGEFVNAPSCGCFPSVLDQQWCGEFEPTPEVVAAANVKYEADVQSTISQTKWHNGDLAGRLLSKAGDNPEAVTVPGSVEQSSQPTTTRVCECDQTHYHI